MEKKRASDRRYREANRDKINATSSAYRIKRGIKPRVLLTPEERKTYNKTWYEANKERLTILARAYRKANKDKISQAQKARREADPEKYKNYYINNREKYLAYSRKDRVARGKEYFNQKQADYQREKKKDPAYLEAYNAKMKEYQRRYRAEAKAKKDNQ